MSSEDEIREIKAYVKAVVGGHVIADNMGYCVKCGEYHDLRIGYCFDCAFTDCPLEKCTYMNLVYNVKRERVLKDSTYTTMDGRVVCNRNGGLCSEALAIIKDEGYSCLEK